MNEGGIKLSLKCGGGRITSARVTSCRAPPAFQRFRILLFKAAIDMSILGYELTKFFTLVDRCVIIGMRDHPYVASASKVKFC